MEVIRNRKKFLSEIDESSDLHSGDVERVEIEWKSLLSLIAYSPSMELPRWLELQEMARHDWRYKCIRPTAGIARIALPSERAV